MPLISQKNIMTGETAKTLHAHLATLNNSEFVHLISGQLNARSAMAQGTDEALEALATHAMALAPQVKAIEPKEHRPNPDFTGE